MGAAGQTERATDAQEIMATTQLPQLNKQKDL